MEWQSHSASRPSYLDTAGSDGKLEHDNNVALSSTVAFLRVPRNLCDVYKFSRRDKTPCPRILVLALKTYFVLVVDLRVRCQVHVLFIVCTAQ